jgi:hypothetical protein
LRFEQDGDFLRSIANSRMAIAGQPLDRTTIREPDR